MLSTNGTTTSLSWTRNSRQNVKTWGEAAKGLEPRHPVAEIRPRDRVYEAGHLTLRHLRPGGLEDFTLALGQALDAMGGNLVENRVDFAADELIGWQVALDRGTDQATGGPGGGFARDERAARTLPEQAEKRGAGKRP